MLERARRLVPKIAARAEQCERLRRLPDETERDLHEPAVPHRPARPGRRADLDVGIFVDVCAEIAASARRPPGTSAISPAIIGCWVTFRRDADALWDVSPTC